MGADGLVSAPQLTEPLPCTLQKAPSLVLSSHSQSTPILGRDLLSRFKAFLTVPNLSPDLARLLLLEPAICSPPHYPPPP